MTAPACIIICSRPKSSRVPDKVFRKIAGVPAINHILNRVRNLPFQTILAVPPGTRILYQKYIDAENMPVFYEGREDSPLHRMAGYLAICNASYVVRITHDDILTDAQSIMEMVDLAVKEKAGYVYNPGIFRGADVEVICRENIIEAASNQKNPVEFISYFVKSSPNDKVLRYECRQSITRNYRLSFDYEDDGKLLEIILRKLGPDASSEAVCSLIDQNPWLLQVNKLPKITVYTCVKNGAKFILDTMTSVITQNMYLGTDFEYIVVDDGSNDDTLLEVSKLIIHGVQLIINEKNIGLASSSNIALARARGKYVIRVDADDKLYPDALRIMYEMMEDDDIDVIYPAYDTGDGKVQNPRIFTHAAGAMMRTMVINEIRFKDGLFHWDSAELSARLRERGNLMFYDKPLFYYRQHAESLSASGGEVRANARKEIGV